MKNTIIKSLIIVSILLLFITLCSCGNENQDNFDNDKDRSTTEEVYETIDSVGINDINEETENINPDYPIFEGKTITAKFTHPEESYSYIYKATVTGKYRFDFDISNVNCNYTFLVKDEKEQTLADTSYSANGTLVNMQKGKTYLITVRQDEGVDFEGYISIGVPLEIQTIASDFISGEFRFKEETLQYKFKPTISGIYRFDFDIDDTNKNYIFIILEENENTLVETSYDNRNNGYSVSLESGTTYKIQIIQDTGLANFKIKIQRPNSTTEVEGKTISGTIRYIDQSDCFLFTPEISGIYRFDFDTSDVTKNYNVKILNSKKTELENRDYSKNGITISLNKGEQYTIFVSYLDGFIDYTIKIGIPQEPEKIYFPFSGTIDYTDQNNIYYFSNVEDGNFIITFDIDNVKSKYCLNLYTSKNELIVDSDSSKGSEKVCLNSNETYRLEISQAEGICSYTINLNKDYSED